ncbi:MAG: DEDD exonuclease domain-containing protein [Actinomycetia bacterium]|nr:DEDD exonuclease domain-containing protein [Actinomycetes bacterium]
MTQPSLLDAGTPLAEVTFCVVDLETTGSAEDCAITELGAVRVRGGEVTGEFQTLVDPQTQIPASISVLTGITSSMVATAPRLAEVLPSFLQFAAGCVLVAHNARFDVGFLKRACAALGHPWPGLTVLDTVALARSVLRRDEVPNCKLGTLAAHFRARVTPDHRALSDARATVDVLHALIERVGSLQVRTVEDLIELTRKVDPARRAKRVWARGLPPGPGVYFFVRDTAGPDGPHREYVYVGTSRHVRSRVRSYFTTSQTRPWIDEMVRVATGVEAVPCQTGLEASVLELRLIAAHAPRYNRRSKAQDRWHWLKLTQEPFPRISVVRQVRPDGARYLGPFRARASAEEALLALYDACPLRRCSQRLSRSRPQAACAQAELGHCPAPCQLGPGAESYRAVVERADLVLRGDIRPVLQAAQQRLQLLSSQQRYEEAGTVHRRLRTLEAAMRRQHRVQSLATCAEIVAARRVESSWEIHVFRYGRLAAAARSRPGENPVRVAELAVASGEEVPAPAVALPAATIEETELIASWLEQGGVRLVSVDGTWSWPLHCGHRLPTLPAAAVAEPVA